MDGFPCRIERGPFTQNNTNEIGIIFPQSIEELRLPRFCKDGCIQENKFNRPLRPLRRGTERCSEPQGKAAGCQRLTAGKLQILIFTDYEDDRPGFHA
jgi:hypothetical protein